jgi:beta-galactosidase
MVAAERASSNSGHAAVLTRGGIRLAGEEIPLYAGSVHYWRLEPRHWRACLESTKALGVRFIDIYVPWSVHETSPGVLEVGDSDPQRDVRAFLRLVHELGLYAIVRPGPHINAELTHFGIPERVVWDPACQARSPKRNPVILPMIPVAFPVPSYASETFLDETARYFRAIGEVLTPLIYPNGPIVLVQVDNEGALYFRDGAYDQDYHPDAIALYRTWLRDKYKTLEDLARAYGHGANGHGGANGNSANGHSANGHNENAPRFGDIEPPTHWDAKTTDDIARHLDWAEFHEHLLARALERFRGALVDAGFVGVPFSHNFPPGQEATPLNAARVNKTIDLVGLDYYARASEETRLSIARRTTELAVRCDALDVPAFACEMGAGFPPFFPPLEDRDSVFVLLAALAYGLRGWNLYMAVDRDRWVGAPIDSRGRERPSAILFRRIVAALDKVAFHTLRRDVPVRILTPRNERRLQRVMHAFGPISGAFFAVAGRAARESAFEDDLGLGYSPAVELDIFTRSLESALSNRGVPFGHIGGEDRGLSLGGAQWILVASSGGLSPTLFARLVECAERGVRVTFGPRKPILGGARRALVEPLDFDRLTASDSIPLVLDGDPTRIDDAVARAIEALSLPRLGCDPDDVFTTVHRDERGEPRVLFAINATTEDRMARISVGDDVVLAIDLLRDHQFRAVSGAIELQVKARSVRMLALSK